MQFLRVALTLFAAGSALAAPAPSDWSPPVSDPTPATASPSGGDPVQEILTEVNGLVSSVLVDIDHMSSLSPLTADVCVEVETRLEDIIGVVGNVTEGVAWLIESVVGPLTHDQLELLPAILTAVDHLLEAVDEAIAFLLDEADADISTLLRPDVNNISIKIKLFVGPINDFSGEKSRSAQSSESDLVATIDSLLKDVDNLLQDVPQAVEDLLDDLSQ